MSLNLVNRPYQRYNNAKRNCGTICQATLLGLYVYTAGLYMTVTKSSSHNVHKQFMKAIERLKAAGGTALQAAIKWTVRIVQKRCYLNC